MFEEILPEGAISVIESLARKVSDFYLAGGTGLALQLGHRSSEDFDFFSPGPFYGENILDRVKPDRVITTIQGSFHCEVKGLRVSFLHYTVPLVYPVLNWRGIRIAHLNDIIAEKIKTVSQRGSKKDFIDLFAAIELKYPVSEACELFKARFKTSDINYYHVLRSLTFFEDAEEEPMPVMKGPGRQWKWESVKTFFIENIARFERGLGL